MHTENRKTLKTVKNGKLPNLPIRRLVKVAILQKKLLNIQSNTHKNSNNILHMNRKKKQNLSGNTRDLGQPRQSLAESIIT